MRNAQMKNPLRAPLRSILGLYGVPCGCPTAFAKGNIALFLSTRSWKDSESAMKVIKESQQRYQEQLKM
jgi:hypothetical protein